MEKPQKKLQPPNSFMSIGYIDGFENLLVIDEVNNLIMLPHIDLSERVWKARYLQERVVQTKRTYKIFKANIPADKLWTLLVKDKRRIYLNEYEELCRKKQEMTPAERRQLDLLEENRKVREAKALAKLQPKTTHADAESVVRRELSDTIRRYHSFVLPARRGSGTRGYPLNPLPFGSDSTKE